MKILIIDEMHTCIVPLLEKQGHEVNYQPTITKNEIFLIISEYEGILVRSKISFDQAFFQKAEKLRFIGRAGAGLDQIDLEEVEKRNIQLLNAPEGNCDALGEHALALLLSLLNNLKQSDRQIEQTIWDREGNRGYELSARTVGVIGFGFMGQAFAKRAAALGCKVLAYDKYKENYATDFAQEASLKEIFEQCDVLSLHIPLTEETNQWINKDFFDQFKNPFWFINTARGKICVLNDLVKALQDGKIIGAGLDVIENEKVKTLTSEQQKTLSTLSNFSNVIISPHIGGWSFESYQKISEVLAKKINEIIR